MPPSDTGAGTGSLVGHDLAALGIPSRRRLCRAYVARTGLDPRPHLPSISPTISSASPRSCRASSAACATAPPPTRTPPRTAQMVRPLAATAWEFAREAGAQMKTVRARARRRRRARARAYRGARGARRDGREAGRDRRHLDRRADRRRLCRRHERPRRCAAIVIALAHNRAEVLRRVMAARAGRLAELFSAGFGKPTRARCGEILRAVPAPNAAGGFRRAANSADRDRDRSLRAARRWRSRRGRCGPRSPPRSRCPA